MQHRPFQPARADDAVRLVHLFHERVKRLGRRSTVGIHVADVIAERGQPETFDERAALADRQFEFQRADGRKLLRNFLHDAERVVAAAVQDDDNLKFSPVFLLKILGIAAQHRFDALLLVVRRDEDEKAGFLDAHWMVSSR